MAINMDYNLDYPKNLKLNVNLSDIPYPIILSPGPTNISKITLDAGLDQPLNIVGDSFYNLMDDIKEKLKYIYQTKNPLTLVTQTSGNGGNETVITNLVDPGERIIVAVAGVWGDKVVDMAKRYNVEVVDMRTEPGEVFSYQELEDAIIKHKPVLLFVTHGESSGGTLQPLDGLGTICHKYNCLLAVDAVVSIAAEPIFVDRWELDAVVGGSQKAVGAPAGMSLLTFSERAFKKMSNKKHPPPYYMDVLSLAEVWDCVDKPRKYHYTYCSNLLACVREALAQICEEGIEKVWARHRITGQAFIEGVEKIGYKVFVRKPENRFHGVIPIEIPSDIKWPVLVDVLYDQFNIEVGFGIGPTLNKCLRVGFLGMNSRLDFVKLFLDVLPKAIKYCRENKTKNGPLSRPEANNV